MVWTVGETTTNEMADDWNNSRSSLFSYYAKESPIGVGWNASLPSPIGIKSGSKVDCNLRPSDIIDPSAFGKLYVDRLAVGTGDGSSWANAYTSIYDALLAIEASGNPTRILVNAKTNYEWGDGPTQSGNVTYMSVDFTIEAMYGRLKHVAGSVGDKKTWAPDGTYSNVFVSTSISQTLACYDLTFDNYLKQVSSVQEVSETSGSMYVSGSNVYVNRFDGSVPDNNFLIIRNFPAFALGGIASYLIRNVDVFGGSGGGFRNYGNINSKGTPTIDQSWSVHDNCTAQYANSGSYDSQTGVTGFVVTDRIFAAFFDCESSRNGSDGFSGSEIEGLPPHILAVNCRAEENGTINTNRQSCNGITMHGGSKLIDINGYYSGSVGSNVGHVDDPTRAWHFGTKAGDSDGDALNGGGLAWGGFGVWGSPVTMWLDCCEDFGSPIGVQKSADAICYIRNHKGTGAISDGVIVLPSTNQAITVTAD